MERNYAGYFQISDIWSNNLWTNSLTKSTYVDIEQNTSSARGWLPNTTAETQMFTQQTLVNNIPRKGFVFNVTPENIWKCCHGLTYKNVYSYPTITIVVIVDAESVSCPTGNPLSAAQISSGLEHSHVWCLCSALHGLVTPI